MSNRLLANKKSRTFYILTVLTFLIAFRIHKDTLTSRNLTNLLFASSYLRMERRNIVDVIHTSSFQSRILAIENPENAEHWLIKGLGDHGSDLNYFELCHYYWERQNENAAGEYCITGNIPAPYWIQSGLSLEQSGDLMLAEAAYRMAVIVEPKLSLGWYRLGHIRFVQKDFDGAIEAHRQTLALENPSFGSAAYEELGRAYLQVNDLKSAESIFQEGLILFPDSRPLHFDMYTLAVLNGDSELAIAWLQQLVVRWPDEMRAWLFLGELAYQDSDWETARQAFTQVLRLDPHNEQAQNRLSEIEENE